MGWTIFSLFMPRFSDVNGRRSYILIGQLITTLCSFTILVSSSYEILIASVFIWGATSSIRYPMTTAYLYETCERKYFSYGSTIEQLIVGMINLIMPFWVEFINKNTMTVFIISFGMQIVALIAFWLLNEAPRYLVKS